MHRFVFSYTSKIDHIRKGLITPNEYVVFDVMVLAAGWNSDRPDYARVQKNVSQLHREHFQDEATGYEVWTRQGLAKLIKSLVAKGYLVEESSWWFIPNYEKWQREIPQALKDPSNRNRKGATPVAKPLVDQAQEIATPVAGKGQGVQPRLQGGATPVAEIATPVADHATPVAPDRATSRATNGSSSPSEDQNTEHDQTTPLTPQGDGGAVEEEKLFSELEEYFTQQLLVPHLGRSDFRYIRDFIERKIPLTLIKQVVADAKRGYRPKFEGDRIKSVGFFVREIETRLAMPRNPVPTGVVSPPVQATHIADAIAQDERLSNKLYELRTVVTNALKQKRPGTDPRFEAAMRGLRQKATDAGIPWELVTAGTSLEGVTEPHGGAA